jgi:hypothetical protein
LCELVFTLELNIVLFSAHQDTVHVSGVSFLGTVAHNASDHEDEHDSS